MVKKGKSVTSVGEIGRASSKSDPGGNWFTLTWMIRGLVIWLAHRWPASQSLSSPRMSTISEQSSSVSLSYRAGSGGGLGVTMMAGTAGAGESGSGGGSGAGMIAGGGVGSGSST